jgi:hypothetical protein
LNLACLQGARSQASRCAFPRSLDSLRCPCPARRQTVARLTGV